MARVARVRLARETLLFERARARVALLKRGKGRGGGGPVRSSRLAAFAIVLVFALPIALPIAGMIGPAPRGLPSAAEVAAWHAAAPPARAGFAPADTWGAPTFIGAIIVDHGQVLAFVGYNAWGGVFEAIGNSTQVFTNQLQVYLFDLTAYNVSLSIKFTVGSIHGTVTTSTTIVYPGATINVALTLPNTQAWKDLYLNLGGTFQVYQYATPISLLPPSVENVGGLDLLVLVVISEMVVVLGVSIAVAKTFMARAIWAPPFPLIIWGHVILIGIAGGVLVDFQWVDSTFAGWSPLVYAFAVAPMVFLFMLSYFNQAPAALILRANTPISGRLSYHAWWIEVGRDPQGNEVLIRPTYSGMLANFFGHYVPFTAAETTITKPEPFVAEMINQRLLSRQEILRRVRRPSPAKSNPLDDFVAIPAALSRKPSKKHPLPSKIYWSPTGMPIDVDWPKITVHKEVTVPAKVNEAGTVLVPEHVQTKLTWPHYTEGKAVLTLASIHFRSVQSVVSGWRGIEDLVKVLTDTTLDLDILKSTFDTQVTTQVRERLLARESALGRTARDLSEEEAAQEAERTRNDLPSLTDLYGDRAVSSPLAPRRKRD